MDWTPSSWRLCPIAQAPSFPDTQKVISVESRLRRLPPLVFEGEIRQLKDRLMLVEKGEAFLLQGGDCAESFANLDSLLIRDSFLLHLQMALALTVGSKKPVVKVGRIAGQLAKPRSSDVETMNGEVLPVYRGDMINGHGFTQKDRIADPERMERAYFHSMATLNLLRAYSVGGFAEQVMGVSSASAAQLESEEFFTSHEALLLNYEEALMRKSENSERYYATSAHMLWIGERTRQLDGAHVEFARGIANPLGIKIGAKISSDELLRLVDRLNPENESGKLMITPRLGARKIDHVLPGLIKRIKSEGRNVVWCCDPMHGNTYTTSQGYKTRSFEDILSETKSFFNIHRSEGTHAGGVHIEFTGSNVIECTGGGQKICDDQLTAENYETLCDPRLNRSQALELALQLVHEIV